MKKSYFILVLLTMFFIEKQYIYSSAPNDGLLFHNGNSAFESYTSDHLKDQAIFEENKNVDQIGLVLSQKELEFIMDCQKINQTDKEYLSKINAEIKQLDKKLDKKLAAQDFDVTKIKLKKELLINQKAFKKYIKKLDNISNKERMIIGLKFVLSNSFDINELTSNYNQKLVNFRNNWLGLAKGALGNEHASFDPKSFHALAMTDNPLYSGDQKLIHKIYKTLDEKNPVKKEFTELNHEITDPEELKQYLKKLHLEIKKYVDKNLVINVLDKKFNEDKTLHFKILFKNQSLNESLTESDKLLDEKNIDQMIRQFKSVNLSY